MAASGHNVVQPGASAPAVQQARSERDGGPSRLQRRGTHRTVAGIIQAAREVFGRSGFAAAEVGEIADGAKVSRTTFYTYFESKDDLLRQMIAAQLPELMRIRVSDHDVHLTRRSARQRIHDANVGYLEAYEEHADLIRVWLEASAQSPELRDFFRQAWEPFLLRSTAFIRQLQQEGLADRELHVEYAARALLGMVSDFAYSWFVEGAPYDRQIALETLTDLWANALGMSREEATSS